jgi:hypothetical protein
MSWQRCGADLPTNGYPHTPPLASESRGGRVYPTSGVGVPFHRAGEYSFGVSKRDRLWVWRCYFSGSWNGVVTVQCYSTVQGYNRPKSVLRRRYRSGKGIGPVR